MQHNYGLLRVDQAKVAMEVRGAEGQLILEKSVQMDEMRFDPDILKYDAFCQIREQSQHLILLYKGLSTRLLQSDWHMIILSSVLLQSIICLILSFVIRVSQQVLKLLL